MSRTYATPAALITISILFPVLGTLTVILRFYTRRKTKSVLWIDDWLTLSALVNDMYPEALKINNIDLFRDWNMYSQHSLFGE